MLKAQLARVCFDREGRAENGAEVWPAVCRLLLLFSRSLRRVPNLRFGI